MTAFDLRQAGPEHVDLIHALRVAGPRAPGDRPWGWDENVQATRFRERFDPARYQLVLVAGQPIGALAVEWCGEAAFLADLVIAPEWRGRGFGSAVIRGLLAEAGQRGLPLTLQAPRGDRARRFYERLGFTVVEETATYLFMRAAPPALADERAPVGLWRGAVRLAPHHPEWPTLFAAEAERMQAALGERTLAIEHVGSTAVPGLLAKPILDIMAGIASLEDADQEIAALEVIGYERRPQGDLPGRLYLVLGDGDIRRVHLSLAEPASPFWRDHLAFRDRLRADPGVVAAYARLKQELASRYPKDRLSYTDGKGAFIAGVLATPLHRDETHDDQASATG